MKIIFKIKGEAFLCRAAVGVLKSIEKVFFNNNILKIS